MRLDNSMANDFRECPWLCYERYFREGTGIERKPEGDAEVTPLELGSRVHELLEEHYRELQGKPREAYPASKNQKLEDEAQWILQKYKTHYGIEDIEILDVERTFEVVLPDYCPKCYQLAENAICNCTGQVFSFPQGRHTYTGKIDLFYRIVNELYIMDHKTEKRGGKNNTPQKWAAKDQATQYLWAAEAQYGQPINRFIVNILTRPSPAGREGPSFPDRMNVERTEIQIETALRDLVYTADRIEENLKIFGDKPWPAHRENCVTWGQCEFYQPHLYGWSDALRQHKFQQREPYLDFGGVQIIQP